MKPLQSPITNNIFHCVTFDAFQRGWIEPMVFIIAYINVKIGINGSSLVPRLYPFPKITHTLEELLLCLLILVKALCE